MGASVSRLRVCVTMQSHSSILLQRFFLLDMDDRLSVRQFFELHVKPQLPTSSAARGDNGYELQRALVRLVDETEDIEVASLDEKGVEYVSMGLKQVLFEVRSPAHNSSFPGAARVADYDHERSDRPDDEKDLELGSDSTCRQSPVLEPVEAQVAGRKAHARTPVVVPVKRQKSLGFFFGNSMKTRYGRDEQGKKVIQSCELQSMSPNVDGLTHGERHCRYCNQAFLHGPAHVQHEKKCMEILPRSPFHQGTGYISDSEIADGMWSHKISTNRSASSREHLQHDVPVVGLQLEPEGDGETEAHDVEGVSNSEPASSQEPTPVGKAPKIRKDGRIKMSGLREGMRRGTSRSIYFKYEVVRHYREMQRLKQRNECQNPGLETASHFGGITPGQVV